MIKNNVEIIGWDSNIAKRELDNEGYFLEVFDFIGARGVVGRRGCCICGGVEGR